MPGESSQQNSRRLHAYTVAENHGILAAEFPLQRQDDNERPQHGGRFHNTSPLSLGKVMPEAAVNRDCRPSNSRTAGSARRMASAPAQNASSTREKSLQSMS